MNKNQLSLSEERIRPHVKDLTQYEMTVFITKPITIYQHIDYIPYYKGQETFVKHTENGTIMTHHALWKADEAIKHLQRIANFFIKHREELSAFIIDFQRQYDTLSSFIEIARERKRLSKGRDHTVWLRKQFTLEAEQSGLYRTMYAARFGSKSIMITYGLLKELTGTT